MKSNKWPHIKNVVAEALLLDPSQHQEYIKKACKGDADLQSEVEKLLFSIRKSEEEGFLENMQNLQKEFVEDLHRQLNKPGSQEDLTGNRIGPYKITEQLGIGGMGAVYKAVRTDGAFNHVVAIKLIKKEILSDETIQRFEQEREILANFNHPNIARLYNGGLTPDGIPYLIMEFVDGKPVTDFCKERMFNLHMHLDLVLKIFEPVMYAHRNLIVHSDLKPGNILVTEGGTVKLLDFGIAKLLDESDWAKQADPIHESVPMYNQPMTTRYASPEQLKGDPVTTASDIYVLGIILYELITGRPPFDFRSKTPGEIEQIISTEKPMEPYQANIHRKELRKSAKDINWICMKALQTDPQRRYGSVQEFKDDLLRFKRKYPVHARPLTLRYRFQRFLSRNKSRVFLALGILLAAVGFGSYHVQEITEQRNIAQSELAKANRIKNFTTDLFYASNPYHRLNTDDGITLENVLQAGIMSAESELKDDEPEVYAEMQTVFGHSLMGLAKYEEAEASLRNALEKQINLYGDNHLLVAETMTLLGRLEGVRTNEEAAMTWLNKALSINRFLFGELSSAVAVNYAEIGRVYALAGNYDSAADYYRKGLDIHEELGEELSLAYTLTLSELVDIQITQGLTNQAEENQLFAIENLKAVFGEKVHPSFADAYARMAKISFQKSAFEQAETYARKTFDTQVKLLGANHPQIINTASLLGSILDRQARFKESGKYHLMAIRMFEDNNLTDSLSYSSYLNNLAVNKSLMGQLDSAAVLHHEVLEIRKRLLAPSHSSITLSMYNLGDAYYRQHNLEQAKSLFEQVVERDKQALGDKHPEVAVDLIKLASVYRDLLNTDLSEMLFEEAGEIIAEKFPEDHHRTGEFYLQYARLRMMTGENSSAIPLLEKSLNIFRKNYSDDHYQIVEVSGYLEQLQG